MLGMIDAPCKTCDEKGCGKHANCEKYKQYKQDIEDLKKQHYKSRDAGEFLAEMAYKTMRRQKGK